MCDSPIETTVIYSCPLVIEARNAQGEFKVFNSQQNKIAFITSISLFWVAVAGAKAAPPAYDFKDPKEISAVSLTLDSKLEPIFGYAKGISGTINFDPAHPELTTGTIAVEVSSVQFANDGYTQTAQGGYGLDGKKFPKITFTLKKILRGKKVSKNLFKGDILADFACHGVTTSLTVPISASWFPGLAEERTNGNFKGDLLVVRTQFNISRTKLGISKEIPINLVGDSVEVRVACVGIRYEGGKKPVEARKTTPSPAETPKPEVKKD